MTEESDLLDFIYPDYSEVLCDGIKGLYQSKGQVQVERQRLDSIRRGAELLGLEVLSQLISQETKQDSIDSLSDDDDASDYSPSANSDISDTGTREIPSTKCDEPLKIGKNANLNCSRCDLKVEITDDFWDKRLIDDFKAHLANVHNVNFERSSVKLTYRCWGCDFVGEDRQAVSRHRRRNHRKKTPKIYKCCNCDFVSDKHVTVVRHLRTEHLTEKSLKCTECDFHTTDGKTFRDHQISEHNKGKYECEVCDRTFTTYSGQRLHYKLAHVKPEERNACYLCSFKTELTADLIRHLADEHNIRRKTFQNPRVYKDKKQCTHCGEVLNSKTFLIDHLADKHRVDLDGNPIEPKYKCRSCDFVAYAHTELYRHNYRKHSKERFPCDQCERKFRNRPLLAEHIRWKHFGEKPYMCEVCGNCFGTSKFLANHRKLHSKPSEVPQTTKQFNCEFCDKSFTRKSLLKQHIRHAHDESAKTHQCVLCSYAAKSKWNLTKHVKSKHNEMTLQEEDIRESEMAIMEVETYELLVEHDGSL